MLKRVAPEEEEAELPEKKAKHAAPHTEQSKHPAPRELLEQRLEYKLSRNDDVDKWHLVIVKEKCNAAPLGWYRCALDEDTTVALFFENCHRDIVWRNAAAAAAADEEEEEPNASAPKANTGAQEAMTGTQEAQDDGRDEKLAAEMKEYMDVVGRQADWEGSLRVGLQWHTAARQIGLTNTRSGCGDTGLLVSWATAAPLIRRSNDAGAGRAASGAVYKRITVAKLQQLEGLVSIWLKTQKATRDEKFFSGGGIGEGMAVGDQPAEIGACSSSSSSSSGGGDDGGDGGGASSSIDSGRPLTTLTLNARILAQVRKTLEQ